MSKEKTRVDFNAPASLVERADAVADLLGISRTQLLVDALRDEIDELATEEAFRRKLKTAYYEGEVDVEVVEAVLGTEEAMRMRLLRDSLAREPPEPVRESGLPEGPDFYDGELSEWTPGDGSNDSNT